MATLNYAAPAELHGLSTREPAKGLKVQRKATASDRDCFACHLHDGLSLSIVVLGASGDLATKKTFPALFQLYRQRFLPHRFQIVGYARR